MEDCGTRRGLSKHDICRQRALLHDLWDSKFSPQVAAQRRPGDWPTKPHPEQNDDPGAFSIPTTCAPQCGHWSDMAFVGNDSREKVEMKQEKVLDSAFEKRLCQLNFLAAHVYNCPEQI
jgi:hypothetical protein